MEKGERRKYHKIVTEIELADTKDCRQLNLQYIAGNLEGCQTHGWLLDIYFQEIAMH